MRLSFHCPQTQLGKEMQRPTLTLHRGFWGYISTSYPSGVCKDRETDYDEPESGSWTEVECAVLGVQGNARRRGMIAIAQVRRCLIAFPITSDILETGERFRPLQTA